MKRLVPFLPLIVACQPTPKVSAEDSSTPRAAPALAGPATVDTTVLVTDADSVPWNRYPRMIANMCFGESCDTSFPAVACREVRLRTAPSDNAPLDVSVPLNDTVNVRQTDLHLEAPGVVVFRKAHVIANDNGDDIKVPRRDTLRFAAGDTLFLLRYYELGTWQAAVRGRKYDISDGFWFAGEMPGRMGSYSDTDSSVAIARSYPRVSEWWYVALRDGRRGFWKFDADAWREGLKPQGKYWEFDCNGNNG